MTLCSGIVCATATTGRMPGSASAAVIRARLDFSSPPPRVIDAMRGKVESDPTSVTATPASADAVAAAGSLLARVDVLRRLGVEWIGIELHLPLGEIALLPRLRRMKRRAARGREQRGDTQQRPRDRRDRRDH